MTTSKPLPSLEILNKYLICYPEFGALVWKPRVPSDFIATQGRSAEHTCNLFNSNFAGKIACNTLSNEGYLSGEIEGIQYITGRIIFKMYYGHDPIGEIDHMNRNKIDNRICNLRDVSRTVNARNCSQQTNNSTGYTGVSFHKVTGKFQARVGGNYLGLFDTAEEAYEVCQAERRRLKYDPTHGLASST